MRTIQLFVKAPPGNGYTCPEAMKRIDDHLTQQTASCFLAPTGMPEPEKDGSWQIRVFDEGQVGFVKFILTTHYGLEILREQELA